MIMFYMYQINMVSQCQLNETRDPHDELIMFYMYQINMLSQCQLTETRGPHDEKKV